MEHPTLAQSQVKLPPLAVRTNQHLETNQMYNIKRLITDKFAFDVLPNPFHNTNLTLDSLKN